MRKTGLGLHNKKYLFYDDANIASPQQRNKGDRQTDKLMCRIYMFVMSSNNCSGTKTARQLENGMSDKQAPSGVGK